MNNGTSIATPWKHSPGDPNATDVPLRMILIPGDKIKFKGGVVYYGGIVISKSGSAGLPIMYDGNVAGDWGSGRAVIDREYLINSSVIKFDRGVSHIRVDGFELRNAGGYSDTDPVVINAANGVYGNSTNAIRVPRQGFGVNMGAGLNTNIYLENLYIHHIGIWHATIGWDGRSISGVGIHASSPQSLTIKNCELTKIGATGISLYAPVGDIKDVLITDCYIHDNIPNWGIDIAPQRIGAKIENVRITKSRFENLWSNWSGTADDPAGSGTTAPHQNYIFLRQSGSVSYWNEINITKNWFGETGTSLTGQGGTGAIFLSQGPSVNIYNNVFARNWSITGTIPIGYPVMTGMRQVVRIYNNTFHRGSGTVITSAGQNIPGVKEVYIENNLIMNDPGLRANNVMIAADQAEPIKSLDYNMYWSPDFNAAQMYVVLFSDLGGGYSFVDKLKQRGFEINGHYSDPLFIDSTNTNKSLRNYHLQPDSPAIGKGKNLSAYFTDDKDGNSRPTIGPWTIGAYEYAGSGGVIVPPVSCTSFTYSTWGTCSNGTQTRSVTSTTPTGCTGGTPVLTQSCTTTPLPGDFNADNKVNSLDFSALSSKWNQSSPIHDLNKDGTVNSLDFSLMAQNWTG